MSKKNTAIIDPDTGEQLVENRSRVWSCIIYPGDSAPDNWQKILEEFRCPVAVSPLHTEEELKDGSMEKNHRHVIFNFGGVKSYKQVKLLTDALHGTVPQPVIDIRSYTRYLIHLDQTDKKQYERSDIITFGDYDLETCLLPSKGYMIKLTMAMTNYIVENRVTEFYEFAQICMEQNQAWYDILLNEKTSYFDKLIRSLRNKIQSGIDANYKEQMIKLADERNKLEKDRLTKHVSQCGSTADE